MLLKEMAAAIASGVAIEPGNGAAAIDEDFHRLDHLIGKKQMLQSVRLWTNSKCLVTTRRFATMTDFASAAAESAALGWPVFVRASGGTTVVHRPGMLNVSRFETWRSDEIDVIARFQHFSDHLVHSLRMLGLSATTGSVHKSYCDGRFNIVSRGRKIAGTASLLRQREGWAGLLSHATICIEGDLRADVAAVARFECQLGFIADYDADAHTNLYGRKTARS